MKIFFVDTETTGLSAQYNDIIQIAGAFWQDERVIDKFNYRCQPTNWNSINDGALKVNGVTRQQLRTFEAPAITFRRLYNIMSMHTKNEGKWLLGGHNANSFDHRFINVWWERHKSASDKGFYEFVDVDNAVDLMDFSKPLKTHGKLPLENNKLGTIIECLGIKPTGNLHDALTDIEVTMEGVWKTAEVFGQWVTEDPTAVKHMSSGVKLLLKHKGILG